MRRGNSQSAAFLAFTPGVALAPLPVRIEEGRDVWDSVRETHIDPSWQGQEGVVAIGSVGAPARRLPATDGWLAAL